MAHESWTYYGKNEASIEEIVDRLHSKLSSKLKEKEEEETRAIYKVYLVDPKQGEILDSSEVVAKNGEEAKLRFLAGMPLRIGAADLDKRDIGVAELTGHFIRAKQETSRVQIVKDDLQDADTSVS